MSELSRILEAILTNEIASFFSLVIVALFLFAFGHHLFGKSNRVGSIDRAAPTLLTTIGVLGTFTGIFLGLLDFDVANVDESVPALLDGLKIAFSTSIVGMVAAIIFRVAQSLTPREVETGEVGPEDVLQALEAIRADAQSQAERRARR